MRSLMDQFFTRRILLFVILIFCWTQRANISDFFDGFYIGFFGG